MKFTAEMESDNRINGSIL